MPDLLSHALIAYTLGMGLSWRYSWISSRYVTVCMAGAFIPDLAKVALVLPGEVVTSVLGVPFSWFGIHTLGGGVIAVLVGVALVVDTERRRVGALLAVGTASHLVADAGLVNASGHSYSIAWPLTSYQPWTPGLYLSTDPWVAPAVGMVALAVWYVTRRRRAGESHD